MQELQEGQPQIVTHDLVNKSSGDALTDAADAGGTFYIKCLTGSNAGKWYDGDAAEWSASKAAAGLGDCPGDDEVWELTLPDDTLELNNAYTKQAVHSSGNQVPYSEIVYVKAAGTGTGAFSFVVTVTDAEANPLEGARVRAKSGSQIVAGTTNASGQVTFNVNAGTFTITAALNGYSYAGGTKVITSDATMTVAMTAVTIEPAEEDNQTRAHGYTRDAAGNIEAGIEVTFTLVTPTTQGIHGRAVVVETSDEDGRITVDILRSATYRVTRTSGKTQPTQFTTTDTDTYALPVM